MQTKRNISELQSDTKKAQLRLKHSKEEMKNKMNELKKTENAYKYLPLLCLVLVVPVLYINFIVQERRSSFKGS